MKKPCDLCGGNGRITDSTGHVDVCDRCFGLGTVDVEATLSDEEARKSRRFYITAGIIAFFLGFYYVALYIAIEQFGLSFFLTLILFVGGHIAIFGSLLLYVMLKALKKEQ